MNLKGRIILFSIDIVIITLHVQNLFWVTLTLIGGMSITSIIFIDCPLLRIARQRTDLSE